jgi:hypothetical protein
MTVILAIDPGSERSAWLLYSDQLPAVLAFAKEPNEDILDKLRTGELDPFTTQTVVIEFMAPRGMPTSAQEMEALWWAGRFTEAAHPTPVERLTRHRVKMHLCGKANANDTNIRAALIDRFGGIGGKAAAVGLKASKGPLYGVSADVWAALAVAVTWADGVR